MSEFKKIDFLFFLVFFIYSPVCPQNQKYEPDQYSKYVPINPDSTINVLIEIPAGTGQKWEMNKSTGELEWEIKDGKKRVVDYLPYPVNYGMIPNTMLPASEGGDGDPLDVIVLGEAIDRGTIIKVKLLGVLYLIDDNEIDHKLISAPVASAFAKLDGLEQLDSHYPGLTEILTIWFTHYKRIIELSSTGTGSRKEAYRILDSAIIK